MQVQFDETGAVATVAPEGELDLARADGLRAALLEAARATEAVVVDLDEVTFMDSAVLGVLVGGVKRCRKQGVTFRVVNAKGSPRRAIELTGLDALFFGDAAKRSDAAS